jgi:hypothetical protein
VHWASTEREVTLKANFRRAVCLLMEIKWIIALLTRRVFHEVWNHPCNTAANFHDKSSHKIAF